MKSICAEPAQGSMFDVRFEESVPTCNEPLICYK